MLHANYILIKTGRKKTKEEESQNSGYTKEKHLCTQGMVVNISIPENKLSNGPGQEGGYSGERVKLRS